MTVQRTKHADLSDMLDTLKRRQIQVGFFDTAHYPDGTPVAYVAAVQEFGYPAGNIPPRPFLRPAVADNRNEWASQIAAGTRAAIRGAIKIDAALEQVGTLGAAHVQDAIRAVQTPRLKDSTIAARRSRTNRLKQQGIKPLVDTGTMLQSVTYRVVKT